MYQWIVVVVVATASWSPDAAAEVQARGLLVLARALCAGPSRRTEQGATYKVVRFCILRPRAHSLCGQFSEVQFAKFIIEGLKSQNHCLCSLHVAL